ncbi:MAG: hypothetical protein K8R67_17575 [Desulfobacteraceae bacterium]|nr:hypothetical protein [Desulfobacteraceae bacterium]
MADQNIEDDGIIDQNDIDKLLEASDADAEENADDVSELSQDDIDALMNGPVLDTPSDASLEEDDEAEEDYELELISQDEINKLVSKKNEQATEQISETIETPVALPQEEPMLQEESVIPEEPIVPEEQDIQEEPLIQEEALPVKEDGTIDESEAVSAEECLVTQENIDLLIREDQENAGEEDDIEPQEQAPDEALTLEEESFQQEEPVEEAIQEKIPTEQGVAMEEEKKEEGIEEEPAADDAVVNLSEDDDLEEELGNIENEELQGGIDDLLDDSQNRVDGVDGDDDWEQDSLISQEDIEDLIKSSENEDEDALGDLDGSDSSEDEEALSDDDIEENDDEDEEEEYIEEDEEDSKVILEESEEPPEEGKSNTKSKKKKKKKKRKPIKPGKKFFVIAASIILFFGILSVAGYFFMTGDKQDAPKQQMVARAMPVNEPVVKSVEIDVDQKSSKATIPQPISDVLISEPLVMKGFVILAPETIEGLAYIQTNITIDYHTNNAYYEIKENMPVYRDIIYLAIQKALGSSKGDKITESDLLVIVNKALKEALPDGSIKKVSFNSFKAG